MDQRIETIQAANQHLHTDDNVYAPHEAFAALVALVDPEDVLASQCERDQSGVRATWRVACVTKGHLIYCELDADDPDWSWETSADVVHGRDVKVCAWRAPWSDVTAGLSAVSVSRTDFDPRRARLELRVEAKGRTPLTVPFAEGSDRERAEDFQRKLLAELP